jgi:hypothetical protein
MTTADVTRDGAVFALHGSLTLQHSIERLVGRSRARRCHSRWECLTKTDGCKALLTIDALQFTARPLYSVRPEITHEIETHEAERLL